MNIAPRYHRNNLKIRHVDLQSPLTQLGYTNFQTAEDIWVGFSEIVKQPWALEPNTTEFKSQLWNFLCDIRYII